MFLDETSQWPRNEPLQPRRPAQANPSPARLFLILALVVVFLPFSVGTMVDIIRYLMSN